MLRRLGLWGLLLLAALPLGEACYRGALLLRARLSADAQVFTLYAVGGSTTAGYPFTAFSFPEEVGAMFAGQVQGRRIVVRNLAVGGEAIPVQWRRLRRAVAYRRGPGAVLIYAGNEPGGPRTRESVGRPARLGRWFERRVAVHSFILTDLVQLGHLWRRWRCGCAGEYSMSSYEFYLRRAARTAQDRGLIPVFSTVVCNLADMEPNFRTDEQTDPAEPRVAAGRRLERAGRWREAIVHYAALTSPDEPLTPYLLYRAAKCWQALGRYDEARASYRRAVEEDTKTRFWRTTRAQNELVRRVAAETGALLTDSAALFERASPHGLPGRELFTDFHHPDLRGYHLLARGFAEALAPALGARPQGLDWDEAGLRRRFGLDDEAMADSGLRTGALLVECAVALYPWPQDRLAMARRAFAAVLRLRPKDRRALLGLALVDSPSWRPRLRDREAMAGVLTASGLSVGRLSAWARPGPRRTAAAAPARPAAPSLPDAELLLRQAENAFQQGRGQGALGLLDRVQSRDLDAAQLHRAGQLYVRLRRPLQYRKVLQLLLARRPREGQLSSIQDAGFLLDLADEAGSSRDPGLALLCVRLARRLKLDAEGLGRTAIIYQRLAEYPLALEVLDGLLREEPRQARWWNDRGIVKMLMGRPPQAVADLEQAVACDPGFLSAYLSLGSLYAASGRRADAGRLYARALARPAPDDPASRALRGRISAERDRLARDR